MNNYYVHFLWFRFNKAGGFCSAPDAKVLVTWDKNKITCPRCRYAFA